MKTNSFVVIIAIVVLIGLAFIFLRPMSIPQTISEINNFPLQLMLNVAQSTLNGSTQPYIYPLNKYGINITPIFNGDKLDVFYAGATSCQFCARTRIPLSIALAKFGSFSKIYGGYSVGDGDYPTIFWSNSDTEGVDIGSSYSSRYINFITADAYQPNSFSEPSISSIEFSEPAEDPLFSISSKYYNWSSGYFSTPLMIIGNELILGAPTSIAPPTQTGSYFMPLNSPPPATLSPGQLINMIYNNSNQYATAEIQSADMYFSTLCFDLNYTPSVCSSPTWKQFFNSYG